MTKAEFRTALDRFGYSQEGFARALGYSERAGQRWATGESEVPSAVAIILTLLMRRPEQLSVLAEFADLSAAKLRPRGRPPRAPVDAPSEQNDILPNAEGTDDA